MSKCDRDVFEEVEMWQIRTGCVRSVDGHMDMVAGELQECHCLFAKKLLPDTGSSGQIERQR